MIVNTVSVELRISVSPDTIFSVSFTPRNLMLHARLYPTALPF